MFLFDEEPLNIVSVAIATRTWEYRAFDGDGDGAQFNFCHILWGGCKEFDVKGCAVFSRTVDDESQGMELGKNF